MIANPIILDTDVGTDVDDAFAIAMAARVPQLKLKAVTTVYGDVQLRARLARKLLDLLEQSDVPVAAGLGEPLTPGKQVYWGGWEGEGFLTPEDDALTLDSRPGVDLIIDTIEKAQTPITLVAIGPLTNIAAALHRRPALAEQVRQIICMAGTMVPGEEEWNVQCDPEAARFVFQSGAPLVLGTRFVVNRPRLKQSHRNRLASSTDPALVALVAMLDDFLSRKKRASTPMYDPVTLSLAFTEEFIQTEPRNVTAHLDSEVMHLIPQSEGSPNMKISVDVQPELFIQALMGWLQNPHER
jgi:purine nucleosidase